MDLCTNQCCGCRSCEQACPRHAITMQPDREGFLKPRINGRLCTQCGLCRKLCPLENPVFYSQQSTGRLFYHNEENWRLSASSSGAFEAVCRAWVKDLPFSIFGCKLDGFYAHHVEIQDWDALQFLKKSKYLQSDTGNTFSTVKQRLAEGRKVVFAGTPCQVMGLTNYLGKSYADLLTVDFVCHGTPSAIALKKYAGSLRKQLGQPVTQLHFRDKHFDKEKGWSSLGMLAILADGTTHHIPDNECQYMQHFLSGTMSCYSCYSCPFAKTARCSDITLGDLWGAEKRYPELGERQTDGVSMLLLNSPKAQTLDASLAAVNARYESLPIEAIIADNRQLRSPSVQHSQRSRFYRDLRLVGFDGAIKWMTYGTPPVRLKRRISRWLGKKT